MGMPGEGPRGRFTPTLPFLVLACSLGGLILRLESLSTRVLWYDEVYSLWIASEPLLSIVKASATSDPHPPGYYLLLAAWRGLAGPEPEAARALSLLAWVICMLVVWRTFSRWFGQPVASWTVSLLSLHAFQIVASTEARMYMPLQLAVVSATYLLWRAVQTSSLWNWAAYGVSAAIAAYLSYYSIFLFLAHAVWIAASLHPRWWGGPAVAVLAALAAYSPWLPFLPSSVTANPVPWRPPLTLPSAAGLLMTQLYGGHWLGSAGYYGGKALGLWETALGLAPLCLLVFGFRRLWRSNRHATLLVACCWIVPLGAASALSLVLGKAMAYAYHLTYLQPFAAVLVCAAAVDCLDAAAPAARRLLHLLAGVVLLGYAAHGADAAWRDVTYQPFRYDLAASYLRALHREGDLVVYLGQGLRRVMHFYFDPAGPEEQLGFALSGWHEDSHQAQEEFQSKLGELFKGAPRRVWVVASPPLPPWVPQLVLESAREARVIPGPTARFGAVTVALFIVPPSAP